MIGTIRKLYRAYAAVQQRRARSQVIEALDERTLRDIGLEAEANRARDRARFVALRVALY